MADCCGVSLVGEDDLQVLAREAGGNGRCGKLNAGTAGTCGGGDTGRDSYGRVMIYSDFSLSRSASREISRWLGLVALAEARRPMEEKSRLGTPRVRLSGARVSEARPSERRLSRPRVSECTERGELA
jgi:hypothetical protein